MLRISNKLKSIIVERYGPVKYDLADYQQVLTEINGYKLDKLNDRALQERAAQLRVQALGETTTEKFLIEAFALAREAADRVLGMRPFDVQVMAGIAVHSGKIAEMQTGEGKTLTAVMPAFLNALNGKGVHILTFNDYLARRDAEWMGPIFSFLGLSTDYVQESMGASARQKAYHADITYVTAREAGFDYLRDFLCNEKLQLVHRPFHYAIVDEADSIMLDEARTPLVIAGKQPAIKVPLKVLAELVKRLKPDIDYEVDRYGGNVSLTEAGIARVEMELGCENLYQQHNLASLVALNSALHAHVLLERDKDYLVRNGKIEIIDEFTGRIADRRHWPDNLQAAVEAKEGLTPGQRGSVLGSIPLQYYLGLYPRLAGMTGTAKSAAGEFREVYGLDVVVIPPNKTCLRKDHPDMIFTKREGKFQAVLKEIKRVHQREQPILIGTGSVAESEELSDALVQAGIDCRVLNAKNDALEAKIIARAGEPKAVTVSTNMAGRGVDIKLGGRNEEEYERVVALGGLYVLGMCRHESRRIDNQLRGRAGRQGDPGESRFFLSLEDELFTKYALLEFIPEMLYSDLDEVPVGKHPVRKALEDGQRIVEGYLSEIRQQLGKYTYLIEQQRQILHKKRQDILTDIKACRILEHKAAERWSGLQERVGMETLRLVEKQLALYYINKGWEEYLEHMSYIRESIHLMVIAKRNPIDEFHRVAIEAFTQMEEQIEAEMISTFNKAQITEQGINLSQEGLQLPSATWTYLINDSPDQFSNFAYVLKQAAALVLKPINRIRSIWR